MLLDAEFKEGEHPRGQPKNAGQFAPKPGGKKSEGSESPKSQVKGEEGKGSEKSSGKGKVAPRQQQVEGAVELSGYLRQVAKINKMPEGMKSPQQFILDNGQNYVVNAKTYEGPRDPMRECYKNATLAALRNKDRTYVEGYITVHGVPIEHAWTVDKTGQVYDSTVTPDLGVSGYFGVPFKTDYVLASGLLNKHYGLLGHESRKTLEPLLKGKVEKFRQEPDPDSLSDSAIADRIAYADAVVRSIPPTDKINTPERQQMRKDIADKLYNKDIEKRKRNREATIVLGLPGAGKSTFMDPLLKDGWLNMGGDEVKYEIPEFSGGAGAFAVHEEGSGIMRNVLQRAVTNGDNLAWERVDSPDKLVDDIKSLKKAGYKVAVKLVDAPVDVAMKSAVKRFLKTGRYVSLENIKGYGSSPRESYEAAIKSGLIDSHEERKRES
jgi:predicted ABC-type ATPase